MNIPLAVLADAANVSQEGKLNIFGCFDTVMAATFPAQHNGAVLVVRVTGSPLEVGAQKTLHIDLMYASDKLMEADFPFTVPEIGDDLVAKVQSVIHIPSLPLPSPGSYVFHLSVDGSELAYIPFRVVRVTQQPSHQAA